MLPSLPTHDELRTDRPGRAVLGLVAVKALHVLSACLDDPNRGVAFKAAVEVMGLVTSCQRHGHGFALDWFGDDPCDEPDAERVRPAEQDARSEGAVLSPPPQGGRGHNSNPLASRNWLRGPDASGIDPAYRSATA